MMKDQKDNLLQRITGALVLLLACQLLFGCAESNFALAEESRLPKWFKVPQGLSREDVKVTMDYYIPLWGRIAVFKLWDKKGNQLARVTGKQKGYEPRLIKKSKNGYPSYEIITVNGITDIIEHRQMEPIFYITDDPAVWTELGVRQ